MTDVFLRFMGLIQLAGGRNQSKHGTAKGGSGVENTGITHRQEASH